MARGNKPSRSKKELKRVRRQLEYVLVGTGAVSVITLMLLPWFDRTIGMVAWIALSFGTTFVLVSTFLIWGACINTNAKLDGGDWRIAFILLAGLAVIGVLRIGGRHMDAYVIALSFTLGVISAAGVFLYLGYDLYRSPPVRRRDHGLPMKEEDLWPPGQMLRLMGVGPYSKSPVKGTTFVMLTQKELVIAGDEGVEDRLQLEVEVDETFWKPDLEKAYRCATADISRVLISHWGATTVLTIWVRDQNGKEKKIFSSWLSEFPETIDTLVTKAFEQGILKKGINGYKVFDKEIERQFKRASPNATVILKGRSMSDEDLLTLVK